MENNKLEREITTSSLVKFALPTVFTMLYSTLFGVVDGIFVARLIGTNGLSAVNVVMPLISIASSLGMMFAAGGSAIVARLIGENKPKEARQTFSLMVAATIISGVIIAILGIMFIRQILTFLGANEEIYSYCYDYAYYILLCFPISMLSMLVRVFLITAGAANFGMVFNIIGGLANVVLDYVFIKYCGMGIAGASIATSIGFAVTAIAGMAYFIFKRKGVLYLVKPKMDIKALIHSCTNGASEMITNVSQSVTIILFNNVLIRLAGADGVAAMTVLFYASDIMVTLFVGYCTGIAPIISYNFGKEEVDRLKKIHRISLKVIGLFALSTFVIAQIVASPLVSVFAPVGTSVYEMAVHGFRIFVFSFLFSGFSVYASAMFTAYSDGRTSAIISAMRTFVFIVGMILLLPIVFGLNGVWAAMPIAEMLGAGISFYFLKKYKNKYQYA